MYHLYNLSLIYLFIIYFIAHIRLGSVRDLFHKPVFILFKKISFSFKVQSESTENTPSIISFASTFLSS